MKIYLRNKDYQWQLYEGKGLDKRLKENHVELGDGVKLGNRVKLGYGVELGDYVKLGYGVELSDYVKLGNDVELGDGVKLDNDVKLGDGVELGDYVKLGYGVKLGDGVKLGNDVKLGYGGRLNKDYTLKDLIAGSLGVYPIKNKYILYKRVNKISKGKYASIYDKNFIYEDGKTKKEINPNMDKTEPCKGGIHLSTAFYWDKGDTLIACEVKLNDIITCLLGKIRCKKVKVIGEIK